jgi:hypothetical protein
MPYNIVIAFRVRFWTPRTRFRAAASGIFGAWVAAQAPI